MRSGAARQRADIGKIEQTPAAYSAAGAISCASKTVSRVLYLTVIYLDAPSPTRSSHLPEAVGPTCCFPTVLLRIEFTAADCLQPSGELLPRLSILTVFCQSTEIGSSALRPEAVPAGAAPTAMEQQKTAVFLCCTFPEVAFGGRYPLSLPCGARTFLIDGLSACPRDCLFYLPVYFNRSFPSCQPKGQMKNLGQVLYCNWTSGFQLMECPPVHILFTGRTGRK